jgi:hypothetical protein
MDFLLTSPLRDSALSNDEKKKHNQAMTTTATTAADSENPSKRRRVEDVSGGVLSLENVNDKCLVETFSYLEAESLNCIT